MTAGDRARQERCDLSLGAAKAFGVGCGDIEHDGRGRRSASGGDAEAAVVTVGAYTGAVVVTVANPNTLPAVAFTVLVEADDGAVNNPLALTVPPPVTDHANTGWTFSGFPN